MSEEATLDGFTDVDNNESDGEHRITGFGTFPSEWDKKDIAECANIRDNERIPLNSQEREQKKPGDIPYYGANGILDYIDEYIFDSELILLAEDGGHFEEYQERTIAYRISGKAWVNNHAHILEARDDTVTDYLFYSLEHRNLVPYVSGSTRSKLTQSMLRKVKIPSPSLPEQRKIATVLYTVDQGIEKTKQTIEQMEVVQEGLLRSLFGKESQRQNPDIETKTERLGPKQFQVPVTWETTEISSIGRVVTGDTPSTDDPSNFGGNLPFVTPVTLSQGKYVTESSRTLSESGRNEAKPIPEGSVMMDCIGSDMGKVAVAGCEVATNQQINSVVIENESYLPEFLYYHLQVLSDFIKSQAGQTATPIVNKSSFESFAIFNPPLEEQQGIVDTLSLYDEGRQSNIEYLAELKRLKRGVMQDLLSGTVRTTDTNIEVPEEIAQYG